MSVWVMCICGVRDLCGANLVFADMRGAHLADATLNDADMGRVNLWHGELNYASLTGAHLREANLAGANLQYANLAGARFHTADMRGAVLHGAFMDARTVLSGVRLNEHTWLGDIGWNGAALTRIDWSSISRIGDEGKPLAGASRTLPVTLPGDEATAKAERAQTSAQGTRSRGWRDGARSYRDAARAYQQLALALQGQGISEPAARYAYRSQVLQRKALWREGKPGRWFFSLALGTLAGYGYRMGRILLAYAVIVALAAIAYWLLGTLGYGPAAAAA